MGKLKNKGGRPSKYDKIDLVQVERLAGLGLIDTEIALVLGICEKTLNNYKEKTEFLQAIKRGKAIADKEVVRSLYERAIGYNHPEVKVFQHNGEIVTHNVTKHYPPDATSMIFWLKNRDPERWRDKSEVSHKHNVTMGDLDKVDKSFDGEND
jgi:hypothetical protein